MNIINVTVAFLAISLAYNQAEASDIKLSQYTNAMGTISQFARDYAANSDGKQLPTDPLQLFTSMMVEEDINPVFVSIAAMGFEAYGKCLDTLDLPPVGTEISQSTHDAIEKEFEILELVKNKILKYQDDKKMEETLLTAASLIAMDAMGLGTGNATLNPKIIEIAYRIKVGMPFRKFWKTKCRTAAWVDSHNQYIEGVLEYVDFLDSAIINPPKL